MKEIVVTARESGSRLDVFLAERLPHLSRTRLQTLIRDGCVQADGVTVRPRMSVREGMRFTVAEPPPQPTVLAPEAIPLDILHEDDDLIVLNKPPGMTVHPAAGHADGTLANALIHHCPRLPGINGWQRPGIVHRLDKDTSGVMVVAKSERAMRDLAAQFKAREVEKEYRALVRGAPRPASGRIETLMGRDTHNRKKMAVRPAPAPGSSSRAPARLAISEYETLETFGAIAWLRFRIATGRTHQIRVHAAHIGHPILGDSAYGGRRACELPEDLAAIPRPRRQMLHAWRIAFRHPVCSRRMAFEATLAPDMDALLKSLRDFFA